MTDDPIQFVDLQAQRLSIAPLIDAAIARVLAHGKYIMGPEVAELESALSDYTGAGEVVTCSSGTDALLMSLMAFGVGPGDAVICPDFTYTATPESIALLGAMPVFVDVDRHSFNLTTEHLDQAKALVKSNGLTLRGVIAVDLFGTPADYQAICDWATSEGVFVLADAAQSFGATHNGRAVGSLGTVTATSFFPAKPLGCYGDGGAVFTVDPEVAGLLRSIRLHGKSTSGGKYDIARIGLNGRLDTLQAAILLQKLRIYDHEKSTRRAIAQRYSIELNGLFDPPSLPNSSESAWAQYTVKVPGGRRNDAQRHLSDAGIPSAVYYPKPLRLQTAYSGCPAVLSDPPVSDRLADEVLSIPVHPYLSGNQQDHIIESMNDFARRQ